MYVFLCSIAHTLLGETNKWIPMSANRINYISVDNNGSVDVVFNRVPELEIVTLTCLQADQLYTRECPLYPDKVPVCKMFG